MSVRHSIKFTADVKDAISDVQKYVESIGTSAATVDRYAASLGGGKLIATAKNWVAAVGDIGNVSRLTAAEQAKVNAILDQAIQKYQALGQQAPTAMTELYNATKKVPEQTTQVQSGLSGIMTKLGPIGPAVIGAFSIGAIKAFVGGMVDAADQIQKMSDRTGDTTKNIQQLRYIAGQTGTSFDGMISAAQNLQQRLGDGDEGAAGAMRKLGLNAAELGKMGATEALYAINEAMQGVKSNTEFASLAADLFGKNWKDMAPALRSDMRGIAEDAPVMSDATVAALDKAGDRWEWLTGKVKVAAAETLNYTFEMARLASGADFWEKLEKPIIRNEQAVRGVAAAMLDASGNVQHFGLTEAEAEKIAKELDATLKAKNETTKRTAASARELADANVELFQATKLLPPAFANVNGMLVQVDTSAKNAANNFKFLGWQTDAVDTSASHFGITTLPTVSSELSNVGSAASGATGPLSGFFDGIKTGMSGLVQGLTGGEGLAGFFNKIGTGITNELGALLTGGLNSLIQKGVAIAWEGAKKIAGYFKEAFGGPNAQELAGREVVAAFETNIASMMNERQKLEAGNDAWKQTVVVVRDAYLALGKTEAEALADVKRLWESSKGGAEAVEAALKPIKSALDAVGQQADETGLSIDELRARALGAAGAVADIGTAGQNAADDLRQALETPPWNDWPGVPMPKVASGSDVPGFANGTGGRFLDFGAGTPVILHGRERVVTEREAASGGFTGQQTIIVQLDGQTLARSVARGLPRQLILAGR